MLYYSSSIPQTRANYEGSMEKPQEGNMILHPQMYMMEMMSYIKIDQDSVPHRSSFVKEGRPLSSIFGCHMDQMLRVHSTRRGCHESEDCVAKA